MEQITQVKNAIIGRIWINDEEENKIFPASITIKNDITLPKDQDFIVNGITLHTDRNLNTSEIDGEEKPLELKSGDKIRIFPNNRQREGMKDAQYTVSMLLPVKLAETIRKNNEQATANWNSKNGKI